MPDSYIVLLVAANMADGGLNGVRLSCDEVALWKATGCATAMAAHPRHWVTQGWGWQRVSVALYVPRWRPIDSDMGRLHRAGFLGGTRQLPWPDDEAALLNGLHVDTYNEPRRYATSLLYLRSVERGGETRFASHPAGAALLERGVESTIDAAGSEVLASELEAAGRALVQPECGTLLLFFTRGADGATDSSAFHGSARPLSCDKWTLQTFWAAPTGEDAGVYARARVRSASERGG